MFGVGTSACRFAVWVQYKQACRSTSLLKRKLETWFAVAWHRISSCGGRLMPAGWCGGWVAPQTPSHGCCWVIYAFLACSAGAYRSWGLRWYGMELRRLPCACDLRCRVTSEPRAALNNSPRTNFARRTVGNVWKFETEWKLAKQHIYLTNDYLCKRCLWLQTRSGLVSVWIAASVQSYRQIHSVISSRWMLATLREEEVEEVFESVLFWDPTVVTQIKYVKFCNWVLSV